MELPGADREAQLRQSSAGLSPTMEESGRISGYSNKRMEHTCKVLKLLKIQDHISEGVGLKTANMKLSADIKVKGNRKEKVYFFSFFLFSAISVSIR